MEVYQNVKKVKGYV